MMKKIIAILSSLFVIASSVGTDISCSKSTTYKAIFVMSGNQKMEDNSFNQSIYEGVSSYIKNILGENKSFKPLYGEAKEGDYDSFSSIYKKIYKDKDIKTVVLNGYSHNTTGKEDYAKLADDNKKSTVIVDAEGQGKSTIGIEFRADMSGFYAGMASIIWSILNNNYSTSKDGKNILTLATYGGLLEGTQASVVNYMEGFYSAVYWWREAQRRHIKGDSEVFQKILNNFDIPEHKINSWIENNSTIQRVQQSDPTSMNLNTYQSGSFTIGKGVDIIQRFIQNKANVIMPVAGRQTNDLLLVIKNQYSTSNVKAVGVDFDNSKLYSSYDKYLITSAEKSLDIGTEVAMSHTDDYFDRDNIQKNTINLLNKPENNNILFSLASDQENLIDISKKSEWKSWEGDNVIVSGDIAHGDKMSINDDFYKKLLSVFPIKDVIKASYSYFDESKTKDYEYLLSESFLTDQAIKIMGK
ncbi:hypothetical protein [Spiroplasma endosymbiont of Aspidapion aeneum]|uniref:hypothetical protein n=1 Tax=Spiroplasma endosymbiont of Aspidapion aeneum TaxID=3066276 RepID=UPI00313F10EF